jgi:uncharacterized protein (DUF433 family)
MGKKIEFSVEQEKDIIDLYNKQNMSLRTIAGKYKCDKRVISNVLKRNNISLKSTYHDDAYNKIKQVDIENIIQKYIGGLSSYQIAREYEVTPSRITQILRKNNIERTDMKIRPEQYDDVVQMYASGLTMDMIAERYHCTHNIVMKVLKRCGVASRGRDEWLRKYTFNEHYFDDIDTSNKAYILGFLYADGCNHSGSNGVSLKLQERDREILEKINKEIENKKPLTFVDLKKQNEKWQNAYEISLFSKHLSETLTQKGVSPKKSHTITFPEWLRDDLYPDFIRGYVDGDGCISKDIHHTGVYIVGTESFCESLGKIFEDVLEITNYHINVPGRAKENNTNTRTIQINGISDVQKFLDWLYKDAELYLQRKYDIYKSVYCNNTK